MSPCSRLGRTYKFYHNATMASGTLTVVAWDPARGWRRTGVQLGMDSIHDVSELAPGRGVGGLLMDTLSAYARGLAAQGKPQRVFDWDKAAALIRERKPNHASAGLIEDWDWTGGTIFEKSKPVPETDTYVYLSSNWATPTIMLDGEEIECWRFAEGSGWDEKTYWPESALAVLRG